MRARDLAFLTAETPQTPLHNATIEIFDPGDSGFDPVLRDIASLYGHAVATTAAKYVEYPVPALPDPTGRPAHGVSCRRPRRWPKVSSCRRSGAAWPAT